MASSVQVTPLKFGSSGSSALHLIPFLLSMLTGIIETEVPEYATHVSYLFVDFPNTLPFMSGDALFSLSLEILTLLNLSTNGFVTSSVGGLEFGCVVSG